MKIPKTLKIGGHSIKIELVHDISSMKDCVGEADADHNKIRISTLYPRSNIEQTLIHEIIHFCFYQNGIELNKAPHTEQTVEGISQVLYQILSDNKMLK